MHKDLERKNRVQRALHQLYGTEVGNTDSLLRTNLPKTSRDRNGYTRIVKGEPKNYELYRNRATGRFITKTEYEEGIRLFKDNLARWVEGRK